MIDTEITTYKVLKRITEMESKYKPIFGLVTIEEKEITQFIISSTVQDITFTLFFIFSVNSVLIPFFNTTDKALPYASLCSLPTHPKTSSYLNLLTHLNFIISLALSLKHIQGQSAVENFKCRIILSLASICTKIIKFMSFQKILMQIFLILLKQTYLIQACGEGARKPGTPASLHDQEAFWKGKRYRFENLKRGEEK